MTTLPFPFDPAHCDGAKAHPSQARFQEMLDDPSCFRELWPQTLSAFDGDDLIAIGGSTVLDGVSGGWVLFTDKVTPARFLRIHRMIVRFMVCFEQHSLPILAHVDPDSPQAARWAGLLGLEMKRTDVLPDGRRMLRAESHVH